MQDQSAAPRILLISASYGAGHVQAAKALAAHCTLAQIPTHHIDLLDCFGIRSARILRFPYLFLTRHAPWCYGWIYRITQMRWITRLLRRLYRPFLIPCISAISQRITSFRPTDIIITHFAGIDVLHTLHNRDVNIPRIGVCITDYSYHPMWESMTPAYYMVGSSDTKQEMLRAGIPSDHIIITGIPVDPVYSSNVVQPRDRITVLLGGYGLTAPTSYIDKLIKNTPSHTPIDIICGRYDTLVQRFRVRYTAATNVTIYGWVDDMPRRILRSIAVHTKTGGLTTTECLVAHTPICPLPSIPGQETENARFLHAHGLIAPHTRTDAHKAVLSVFSLDKLPIF